MRDALDLTVMSYNVLSDLLMKRHKNLYPNSKEEDLAWDTRWKRIVQEVQTYNPDIFCLQEVQVDHWESHFVPSLTRLGYSGVYKQVRLQSGFFLLAFSQINHETVKTGGRKQSNIGRPDR